MYSLSISFRRHLYIFGNVTPSCCCAGCSLNQMSFVVHVNSGWMLVVNCCPILANRCEIFVLLLFVLLVVRVSL